jgi:type IV pilus assembly protein PilB
MYVQEKQLREFIADSGLISKPEFDSFAVEADKNGTSISSFLLNANKISEDDLRKVQAYILGVPFVDLKDQKVSFEVLSIVPEPIARNHNIIAYRKTNDNLEVAMLDTDDLAAIDFIQKKTGLRILPRLTDTLSLKTMLLQYQKTLKAEFGDIIKKEALSIKSIPDANSQEMSASDLKKMAEDFPVVRIVDTLLKHAIIQNASDIHIEPLENQVVVRYRVDGILQDAMILPRDVANSITARIKVLSNLKLDEKRLPQDGRFKIETSGEKVSFRVSLMPVYYGEKTVMRLLRENAKGFTLEALGIHGEALERIHSAMKQKTGMILATGPTGSGKTTTLYTVLDILNTPQVNIATIEDPVEYQMQRINQTQVKPEIGFSFSSGLRSLLRQDPDIVMVGEIRDGETASLAINAALTGHLVLSTLHTNSAAGAIPRMIDMKVEPFLIVSTINLIIAQRLVRKLTESKEKYFLSKDGVAALRKIVNLDHVRDALLAEKIVAPDMEWEKVSFFHPKATPENKDGYRGRSGIREILRVSPAIKEMVMRSATADEIHVQAAKEGMLTMLEDGIFQAAQGITTIEEVLRVITD